MPSNNDLVNQIQNSLDIVEIIGEKVRLIRSGNSYKGLCPFHSEKTPSFHVFPDTQSYYCFGCHKGGNIFSFVMRTEGLEFREALEFLAKRAGINYSFSKKDKSAKSLYDVAEMAAEFFKNNLKSPQGTAAQAYMKRRNLNEHDIENFMLGYSPVSWDALSVYLKKSGVPEKQILNSGLAIENKNHIYDRFRGRLIFPVKDITGRVIAFGGRLIDGEGAKYINSPECEIFSKKNNLYLLYEARNAMRKKARSILVEGYMDAVRLHKCGFTEAVASLGTSLTSEQANLLARFSDTCYICYDTDKAGQEAALRGMYILREAGLDVRVVSLPEGKDPDEFLSANPPEKFEDALKNAQPLVLKHLDFVKNMLDNPAKYNVGVKSFFDGLSKLDAREINIYQNKICETLMIDPLVLKNKLIHNKNFVAPVKNDTAKNFLHKTTLLNNDGEPVEVDELEAGFCALLWNDPYCLKKIKPEEIYTLLKSKSAREIAFAILNEGADVLKTRWLEFNDEFSRNFIAIGEGYCSRIKESERWDKICKLLKETNEQNTFKNIYAKLIKGEATNNELNAVLKLNNYFS